jgi:hypothetical protein
MRKLLPILIASLSLLACTTARKGKVGNEKIPDIYGTWYQDGNKDRPCFIVQNGRDLVFMSGNETSGGHFRNSFEVLARDWNRNAILSQDLQILRWADRKWTRGSFVSPDISGAWIEADGSRSEITITQDKEKLVIASGAEKLSAYFYTTNGFYVLERNSYGTYSPSNKTISWDNKTWSRKTAD